MSCIKLNCWAAADRRHRSPYVSSFPQDLSVADPFRIVIYVTSCIVARSDFGLTALWLIGRNSPFSFASLCSIVRAACGILPGYWLLIPDSCHCVDRPESPVITTLNLLFMLCHKFSCDMKLKASLQLHRPLALAKHCRSANLARL